MIEQDCGLAGRGAQNASDLLAKHTEAHCGPQHDADFTSVFREALKTIPVVTLRTPEAVTRAYALAVAAPHSTLLVEYTDLYKDRIPSVVGR